MERREEQSGVERDVDEISRGESSRAERRRGKSRGDDESSRRVERSRGEERRGEELRGYREESDNGLPSKRETGRVSCEAASMRAGADLSTSGQLVESRIHVMNTERSVLGATSCPCSRLKSRLMYAVHAEPSSGRSRSPVLGGWKR